MTALTDPTKKSSSRNVRILLVLLLTIETVIFAQCLRSSLGWINEPFPGFLVLKNRAVAAAGCPFWQEMKREKLFHAQVEEINGHKVHTAEDVQAFMRSGKDRANTPVWYQMKAADGEGIHFQSRIHRFGFIDFLSLFGVYMLNGLLYLLVGVVCVFCWPRWVSTPGFLAVGVATSLWTFTACDLYGPYRFFQLHILAESLLPAAILHLAWVFPTPPRNRKPAFWQIPAMYLGFGLFALFYENNAMEQAAYSLCNRVATAALGFALLALLARCTHAYFRKSDRFSRTALRSLLIFAFVALGPSVCVSLSMALQGYPPVNYLGYTSFLLPVGFALAVFLRKKEEKDGAGMKEAYVQKAQV